MGTFKIAAVLGLLAAVFAVGLAYAWAAVAGTTVTGDEVGRHVLLSVLVAASVTAVLRRPPRGS